MDKTDDQYIINRVLNGDANAFGTLVKRYQKPIFNLMVRISGSPDQAADLAQETFIKAYEKLEHFRPGNRFLPWLYAIGLNHGRDFLRKSDHRQSVEVDSDEIVTTSGHHEEQSLHDRLDFDLLEKALNLMATTYREAIILRYHEELSMRDIAAALQISVSAAKMRVSRGLEMLRQSLKGASHGQ